MSDLRIAFFSRGRGRGHAYHDIDIAREVSRLNREACVSFVSYATGAETFRHSGHEVLDLELPENNDYTLTIVSACEAIKQLQPDIVVAHEEFAALTAARIINVPSIFVSAWLPPPAFFGTSALALCDAILLLGNPGTFPIGEQLRRKTLYWGPMVRTLRYSRGDRVRLRSERGIDEKCFVITVVPGGWASEERVPLAAMLLEAFGSILGSKALHWVSQQDENGLRKVAAKMAGVTIHGYYPCIEELYALSDVVVTKGTYATTMEAASLGIPTISLSAAANPIDEILVPRIRSNLALHIGAIDAAILAAAFEKIRAMSQTELPQPSDLHERGGRSVAEAVLRLAAELRSESAFR